MEGWTPRGDTGFPPQGDGQGGEHSRGGRRGASSRSEEAETPPDEGQEDARGAHPPSGSLLGEMLTLDFGPLAPRRVHLALMYEW